MAGEKPLAIGRVRFARITDSSSKKAVTFSSACITKRLPSPRWRFVAKKQCNKLRGARILGDLTWRGVHESARRSNNRLSAPVSARSRCKRNFNPESSACHAKNIIKFPGPQPDNLTEIDTLACHGHPVSTWVPVNPNHADEVIDAALQNRSVGILRLRCRRQSGRTFAQTMLNFPA